MTTSRRKVADRELREIDFYLPEDPSEIDIQSIRDYVGSIIPTVKTRVRPSILLRHRGFVLETCAISLASSRVKDPTKRVNSVEPMYGEIDYERRAIAGKAKVGGIVYDGRKIERVCRELLKERSSLDRCSVVFTGRLLSTYSYDDMRYHLRTIVCGFPSLVSIPGVIEAPARPKEYYLMKQQLDAAGLGERELLKLRSAFRSRFIDYGDPSVNEVLKGLALQAIIFHMTLDPFCDDPTCRLFNAHWQEELIESQVASARLCERHAELVRRLGERPALAW